MDGSAPGPVGGTYLLPRHRDLEPLLRRNQVVLIVRGSACVELDPVHIPGELGTAGLRIVVGDGRSGFMPDIAALFAKGERLRPRDMPLPGLLPVHIERDVSAFRN